jgi:phenylacetic acid degradation operon negative regulatory protein
VLDRQCVRFRGAESDIAVGAVRPLFDLGSWSDDAQRLIAAMDDELSRNPLDSGDVGATLTYQFTLSIAAVRHLELDPQLPPALLPENWPAQLLRRTYRTFDDAFQRTMQHALGRPAP